jgi:hypothetical protein
MNTVLLYINIYILKDSNFMLTEIFTAFHSYLKYAHNFKNTLCKNF